MRKKLTCFTALLAATALAACSGGDGSGSNEADGPAAGETAETAEVEAEVEAAPEEPAAPVDFASLTGDAAAGENVFAQCRACHVLDEGVNRVGPSLHNIIGRTAGQVEGFNYSEANKNSGYVWSEEQLFEYLEDPRAAIPGTKMVFAGLPDPQDRADVIAYLATASEG